tara:strand:+ start:6527 stop:6853 length:327 start_codon:yes stop_codon:yes gene_type:complete
MRSSGNGSCRAEASEVQEVFSGLILSDRRIQKVVPVYVLPPDDGAGVAIGADFWVDVDLMGRTATRIVTVMSGRNIRVPSSDWDEFVESHRQSATVKAEAMMGREYWG